MAAAATVMSIYLRPLTLADAGTSWQWRNDADVWQYTGSRPDQEITEAIETAWLEKALQRPDERRYAICLTDTHEYIGNVQLTHITARGAQVHLFIGAKQYWGKGYGRQAIAALLQMIDHLPESERLYLQVHPDNTAAIRLYEAAGFVHVGQINSHQLLMEKRKASESAITLSVFMMSYNHASFIGQALQGVFDQQVDFPIEIVLGDDASTDDTRAVIFRYYQQRPWLFRLLLPNHNSGAVHNQWQVFDACRGEYIAMLEGDDYWTHPHKLQTQVTYLQQQPTCSICFHNAKIVDGNHTPVGYSNVPEQPVDTQFDDLAKGEYIYTATCVFRSQYLQQYPREGRPYMNNYTLDLFNAQFGSIHYINEVWSVYRQHMGGTWSMKPRLQTLLAQLPTYEYYLTLFGKKHAHHFINHLRVITHDILQLSYAKEGMTTKAYAIKKYVQYHGGWMNHLRLIPSFLTSRIQQPNA